MDDRSLEEFLDAGEESTDGGDADRRHTTPTARWTPAGAHCDRCERETGRLWADGDEVVCRSCKEW